MYTHANTNQPANYNYIAKWIDSTCIHIHVHSCLHVTCVHHVCTVSYIVIGIEDSSDILSQIAIEYSLYVVPMVNWRKMGGGGEGGRERKMGEYIIERGGRKDGEMCKYLRTRKINTYGLSACVKK